jgi:hypothetical protein
MPDIPVRVGLLRKMHLFRGLSDAQLNSVAAAMQEQTYDDKETVFVQGTSTETFYIVFSGSVDVVVSLKKGGEKRLASLFRGDYFGEQSLLRGGTHNATVRASKGTILLKIYRDKFKELLKTIPSLRDNFKIMMKSRELARQKRFPWLNQNEVVYFLSRRHEFILYQMWLGGPALGLILSLATMALGLALGSVGLGGAGGFGLVLMLAWGVWIYVDWNNDFYVVTNQRVVVIQKVVLMYDSREEALMGTILSVNTETDAFGRLFKYGTIVVRTFTGELRMNHAPDPKHAATMIEEYWLRSKEVIRQHDENVMKDAIRRKLGIPAPGPAAPPPPPPPPPKPAAKPTLGQAINEYIREIFYVRKESGGTVTYHKHWIVLVKDVILQTVVILGLLSSYILWPYFAGELIPLALGSIVAFLIVAAGVWWVYGFLDWRNDLYQVTPEQIVDVYRVPFGDEDRKSAPLENILSTEYKRTGFWGLLFNFGVVNIQVGGTTFDFRDVADPPSVQKDIIERMNVRLQKKREADTAAERERMAEWLAMYHRTMSEIEKQAGQSRGTESG